MTSTSVPTPLKLFVTGDPGCGKTTAIRRVVERLQGSVTMRGFVTEEWLERGRRRGFRGVTLAGDAFPLADRKLSAEHTVGPYGVELAGLNEIGLVALTPEPDTRLIVLDEVGKMEAFSEPFRLRVERLLAGDTVVLGTVAAHGVGFVKRVRQDKRVTLLRMRRRGRDGIVREILAQLAEAGIAKLSGASGGGRS